MTRLVLIDDHALFRAGLVAILKKDPSFEIVGEYGNFDSVKPLIPKLKVDIILVDISLGKENGFEVATYIKNVNPLIKAVVLSSHKEEFYVINAMQAEVDGYIHKNVAPEELIAGLHKIINGERFFSGEILNVLINNVYNKPQRSLPFLTGKEKQIVKYLMDGYSSKEIAGVLDVSPRTIETHRANVLNKFNLRNTTELVRNILEQKIKF